MLPAGVVLTLFFGLPLVDIGLRSVTDPSPANYLVFGESSVYGRTLWTTFRTALLVTAACLLLGPKVAVFLTDGRYGEQSRHEVPDLPRVVTTESLLGPIREHVDAINKGEHVLLVDDLIATGGTAEAAAALIGKMGATVVECAFIVDLPDVGGRKRLEKAGLKVFALCEFEGE